MIDIQILLDISEELQEKRNLDKGKSFLEALYRMDLELAEEIKGTNNDPSLGEKNYIRFMNYLLTHNLRVERKQY
jgi:hypothetical protein